METFENTNTQSPTPVFKSLESWSIYIGNERTGRPHLKLLKPILNTLEKSASFKEAHVQKSGSGRTISKAGFLIIFTQYVADRKERSEKSRSTSTYARTQVRALEESLEKLTKEVAEERSLALHGSEGADEKS